MKPIMIITIEDDCKTITTQCGKVAALDHQVADDYLEDVKLGMGGAVTMKKESPHGHVHQKSVQKAGH